MTASHVPDVEELEILQILEDIACDESVEGIQWARLAPDVDLLLEDDPDWWVTDDGDRVCEHCAALLRAEGETLTRPKRPKLHTGEVDGCDVQRCEEVPDFFVELQTLNINNLWEAA